MSASLDADNKEGNYNVLKYITPSHRYSTFSYQKKVIIKSEKWNPKREREREREELTMVMVLPKAIRVSCGLLEAS